MDVLGFVSNNWGTICGAMYIVCGILGHVVPEPLAGLLKAIGLDFNKASGAVSDITNPKSSA